MDQLDQIPVVDVGLISSAEQIEFSLLGYYRGPAAEIPPGEYRVSVQSGALAIEDICSESVIYISNTQVELEPMGEAGFTVRDVVIGIDFHWERHEDQSFEGGLILRLGAGGHLTLINRIEIERYLYGVISSEMSPTAHPELLKAHAIISRSWLLAQLAPWRASRERAKQDEGELADSDQIIRWYDRDNHEDFDICADDHCQRYQGIGKATREDVFAAVNETCGIALYDGAELCDARFSKACGGMTEEYATAWEDRAFPYLVSRYDGEVFPSSYATPLNVEENARRWIEGRPEAFCDLRDESVIGRVLPDFDQETRDFYRWEVTLEQVRLRELLEVKAGLDLGRIRALTPLERGASGRLIRLRIEGEDGSRTIGKELEIRRLLSPKHLYSSAITIDPDQTDQDGYPRRFRIRGAGWGHGVGLCQIGAAVMAEKGYDYRRILAHYYRGASLERITRRGSQ